MNLFGGLRRDSEEQKLRTGCKWDIFVIQEETALREK
jgi:hypothetical protein